MQISSRFTVALHIFACVEAFGQTEKITSDFLSASINTNPVIIRRILGQLKKAELIDVARGTGGVTISRPLEDIRFYDIYQAIEPVSKGQLFNFHDNPNDACPVGANIHRILDPKLAAIQDAMEAEMKRYTLANIQEELDSFLKV